MSETLEREASTQGEFRIYAACLAAYNNGRLHGEWIDLDGKEESDVWQAINAMLAKSPCPNVTRYKCPDCDHIQSSSLGCDECGHEKPQPIQSAEEWALHDHEGFGNLISSEWPDIGELCELVEFLEGADDEQARGFRWLVDDRGYSVSDAISKADDVRTYEGEANDYAAEFADDCYSDALEAIPDFLRFHIDWQGVARDLELGGDIAKASDERGRFIVTNATEF